MLIRRGRRMPMPGSAIAVAAEHPGAVEHHRVADELLASVDVNLDKTVGVDVQPHGAGFGIHRAVFGTGERRPQERELRIDVLAFHGENGAFGVGGFEGIDRPGLILRLGDAQSALRRGLALGEEAKALIRRVAGHPAAEVSSFTAETLADRRISPEGQEGMRAFLEKRAASWVVR